MAKDSPPRGLRPRTNREALERAIVCLGDAPAEAERLARSVLRAERGNVLAAQILGEALLIQARPADAVVPLERAARMHEDAATEALLARALLECGRDEAAVAALRNACTRRPAFAPAFVALGEHLREQGALNEAVEVFEQGLALLPEADALRLGLGYVALDRGDRSGARRWFFEASDASFATQAARAQLAVAEGDYAAAATLYAAALERRPGSLSLEVEFAQCLLEIGRRAAAETLLRRARRTLGSPSGRLVTALAQASHGRAFLRPSAAERFLHGEPAKA